MAVDRGRGSTVYRPKIFASFVFACSLLLSPLLPVAAAADQHAAQTDGHAHSSGHESPSRGRPSDVLFAVYYIPVEGYERKSLDVYIEALPQTCSFLEQFGHNIAVVGNHSFVRSIPGCEKLEPEGPDHAPQDLRHGEAASIPSQNGCRFQRRATMDTRVVQIWLNKIEVLCDLGDRYPDRRIILVDAGLAAGRRLFVEPMLEHFEGGKFKPDDTLTMPMYRNVGSRQVGGSHRLRSLYREALQNTSHLALQADATGEGCPCYTEEDVIKQMYKHHPSLFTLVETLDDGTPGAVRTPGNHPPIMEWHNYMWQERKNKKRQKRANQRRRQRRDEF